MRRSLLLRLLGLSLGVASTAVCATAVLATHDTAGQLRDTLEGDASLLETDSDIRSALLTYANEHRSWDGVEALVRGLAQRTGRRIALTTTDGEPIGDSARLLGNGPEDLPSTPSARLDAATLPTAGVTLQPNVVARDPGRGVVLSHYVWQPTEEERQQRQESARTGGRLPSPQRLRRAASGPDPPPGPAAGRGRIHDAGMGTHRRDARGRGAV